MMCVCMFVSSLFFWFCLSANDNNTWQLQAVSCAVSIMAMVSIGVGVSALACVHVCILVHACIHESGQVRPYAKEQFFPEQAQFGLPRSSAS